MLFAEAVIILGLLGFVGWSYVFDHFRLKFTILITLSAQFGSIMYIPMVMQCSDISLTEQKYFLNHFPICLLNCSIYFLGKARIFKLKPPFWIFITIFHSL